jgi:hypothetical protein
MGWNRTGQQFSETLRKGVLTLEGTFAIGATGAPTKSSGDGFTIARTGTGAYTLTLDEKFYALVDARFYLVHATVGEYSEFLVLAEDVDGAKTIGFVCHQAGTATELTSGAVLKIVVVGRKTEVK